MIDSLPVLQITDAAKQHILKIMQKRGKGLGFRVSIKRTGCSGYMYVPEVVDEKQDSDYILSFDDLNVFIDAECISMLRGSTLDLVQKSLGLSQLQFNNPNAKGLCGCGESFHLNEDQSNG